jgi:hypothetical protein
MDLPNPWFALGVVASTAAAVARGWRVLRRYLAEPRRSTAPAPVNASPARARGRQAFCSLEIVSVPWYSAFGLRTMLAGHRQ